MQIEDYLYQKKLYQPLSGVKPEDMKQEEWNLLDRQALGVIRLTLAKNVAFNIVNEKTTVGLMKALSDMYEKPSAANKVYLMRRLFNLKMGEGISVTDHINEFHTILAQLESVQIKFEDEVKALILLSSLPDSWAATVTAVSSSTRENALKLSDIRDLILSEDVRKRDSGESSSHVSNSTLNTEGRGRTTQKGQNGRGRSKSRRKGFGLECGVKLPYVVARGPQVYPSNLSNNWYQSRWFKLVTDSDEYASTACGQNG
ncbi:Retrovirus-related Pol polyprotein from transposon TNT 1-94 [Glycine soja]|nr:Retrovirus-related Pol polyprotein from transposon TNT 1-94 [Glycine max]